MDSKDETRTNERGALLPTVLGFVAGALSGAAVALLLAPASGRDTRGLIGGAYRKSTQKVASLPAALKSAGKAARIAFVDAQAEQDEVEAKDEPALAGTNTH